MGLGKVCGCEVGVTDEIVGDLPRMTEWEVTL